MSPRPTDTTLSGLRCVSCSGEFDHRTAYNTCPNCGSTLGAVYDYERAKEKLTPAGVSARTKSLWRYAEVLPVEDAGSVVTLGEGFTPITRLTNGLLLKDDGLIPTGTFKARGMAVAVSRAKELGVKKLAVPSAGNAAGALACYAARAGLHAKVYVPLETPRSMVKECMMYGADVVQVEGSIGDAGAKMKAEMDGYFDMSTLKEPYRLEGKKTMGYEIAEQMGFELPDVILYPTGGGTGLLGMWKAFAEMEELGWIGSRRPRMFSVQSERCSPVVDAYTAGAKETDSAYPDGATVAAGLRVPRPFAGSQMLSVLRQSEGGAVKVPEGDILKAMRTLAKEGVFACPEGGATLAGYDRLRREGGVGADEEVLLYNTGTGLKYLDLFG